MRGYLAKSVKSWMFHEVDIEVIRFFFLVKAKIDLADWAQHCVR